ncbi:MAG: class F sortase [Jatrophihabitans sp.]|nr:MAG: class F sortase [Jatrophihabitans sp.]
MGSHTRRVRHLSTTAGVVLLVAGVVAIVAFVTAQQHAPQPPASAARPIPIHPSVSVSAAPPAGSSPAPSPSVSGPVLARSLPVTVRIPSIGVDSSLGPIGLTATGEIRTPPLDRDSHAYWLDVSPTPGQPGPAVILGHVDSAAYGPAVFFRLGDVRPGDRIYVTLADGQVGVFEAQQVVEYRKADFPTLTVYGNTKYAALRLITCGGTFDRSIHSYESNIVVFAELISSQPA